ncbi:MAG: hypothetical protein RL263_1463 [Bacteroidota bacterium]
MRIWCFFIILLSLPTLGYSQSRKTLEARRLKIERELAESQKILKTTQKEKNATLHQLNTLSRIIEQREVLISNLTIEVVAAESEIQHQSRLLDTLMAHLQVEKLKLSKTVRKAYKTRKSGREVAFVFTSTNLKQALRRWKYLRKLSDYRRFQISQLNVQQTEVEKALMKLNAIKAEKTSLLGSKEQEKQKLEVDKESKVQIVKTLSAKEDELQDKIRQKRKQMAKLDRAIKLAIAREIEAERKRQARNAQRTSTSAKSSGTSKTERSESSLTPESRALSNSFSSNRGGLPWPVDRGFISQRFGVHSHPEFKNITLENNGVDITTSSGSRAKAVFKGTVSAILSIPGQGEAVLVNHGEYFTVYSRLSSVTVSKGEQISTGTTIGQIMEDDDGKFVLQFQVWQGQDKQNPEGWLKSR